MTDPRLDVLRDALIDGRNDVALRLIAEIAAAPFVIPAPPDLKPGRGICPACGDQILIRRDGQLWTHKARLRGPKGGRRTPRWNEHPGMCPGGGK